MSTSLVDKQALEDVGKLAGELTDKLVTRVTPIRHGGNSRLFRLEISNQECVMKFYFQHPSDTRDRLGTEFKSLSFLWDRGNRQVPQCINAWPQQSCALYECVDGALIQEISSRDIDTAADFLVNLKTLKTEAAAKEFSSASEAFFSPKDIVAGVRNRLKRFGFHQEPEYKALKEYLYNEFMPLLDQVEQWAQKKLADAGIAWEQTLDSKYRTLSPSDFGFHNAIRRPDGHLCFLDFEYFGWDDPVKMTADFLWHPAMNLKEEYKHQFTKRMQDLFNDDTHFQTRLETYFPVFGLKWCLICLNEFVASDAKRRDFAGSILKDKATIRFEQLVKAKNLSSQIKETYRNFPYASR